ncbi:MAG TPA: pyridoxamine 5'-phosphate oxidase family protein [Acidimicrobiales bacterium]|nr:pyridoxamine 5'-phosphate oxidase family protein [Acidimicrobiales bacterium]
MAPSPWHDGERAVQQRVGEVHLADRVAGGVGRAVPEVAAAFLAQQPMLVVAAAAPGGDVWTTLLTGPPGFLAVPRPDTLEVAAAPDPGDPLHGVLGGRAPVGALAIEPATRRRMRLNGRSHPVPDGLRIDLDQVFANCPKHIRPRQVVAAHARPGDGGRAWATAAALSDRQADLVAAADTFFLGTTDAAGNADASHRGGDPGFVEVVDGGRRLRFPDYRGNSMYMTLGNLEQEPRAGLLFLDWTTGDVVQVTGRARVRYEVDAAFRARHPRARRAVEVEVASVVERSGASPLTWATVA